MSWNKKLEKAVGIAELLVVDGLEVGWKRWLLAARDSGLLAMARMARTIEKHLRGIINAIVSGILQCSDGRPQRLHPADQAERLRLPESEKFPGRHPVPLRRPGLVSRSCLTTRIVGDPFL